MNLKRTKNDFLKVLKDHERILFKVSEAYCKDPEDRNIRIAPSVPTVPEVVGAMEVFVTCVKLASVKQQLASIS